MRWDKISGILVMLMSVSTLCIWVLVLSLGQILPYRNLQNAMWWTFSSFGLVLRPFFTDEKSTGHNLCPWDHSFALPSKYSQNLVSGILYGSLLKCPYTWIPTLNYTLMVFFSFLACLDLCFIIISYMLAYQLSLVNLNCACNSCGVSLIFNEW